MDKEKKEDTKLKKDKNTEIELEKAKKQAEEYLSGWKRAQADYINLKRRVENDIANLVAFANEELIKKILPVLDNFKRAFLHIPKEKQSDSWILGIKQVEKQLEDILKNEGLEKIEVLGKEFDPQVAEAIAFENQKNKKDNEVIEEIEAGYRLKGKVIRPAKVKICKK